MSEHYEVELTLNDVSRRASRSLQAACRKYGLSFWASEHNLETAKELAQTAAALYVREFKTEVRHAEVFYMQKSRVSLHKRLPKGMP